MKMSIQQKEYHPKCKSQPTFTIKKKKGHGQSSSSYNTMQCYKIEYTKQQERLQKPWQGTKYSNTEKNPIE